MKTKVCSKCKQEKELSEFYKDIYTKDKLSYKCKICYKKFIQIPRIKQYRKKYYQKYYKLENGKNILNKAQKKFIKKRIFCCKTCANKISLISALYGHGNCRRCSRTLELRKKLSDLKIGFKHSKKTKLKISKATKGKNNPNWKHGLSLVSYASNFSAELKHTIRQRDNFICQGCGLTEKQEIRKHNQVLSVHHIDYNKYNCDKNNLITVCVICNNIANGNKEYDRSFWYSYYKYKIDLSKRL